MNGDLCLGIKKIIVESIKSDLKIEELGDDYQLIGNILDSMAVNLLIVELEGKYGIVFNEDDLQAEFFETISSLASLVERKIAN